MKKLFLMLICSVFLAATYTACTTTTTEETESDTTAMEDMNQTSQLKISPAPPSPDFPDAILKMSAPKEGAKIKGKTASFKYEVTNYKLGAQTEDASQKQLANSDKGQHVHLILNNNPYYAIYEPTYQQELENGHYVALSFLSRSYHESVKTPDAYVVSQFDIGTPAGKPVDLSAPMLFYSRPKGTYSGQDTERILFDFYLVNTALGSNGNQVRVTVNNDTTFNVTEWQPYIIEGLPMGENTIKIELVDSQGKLIDSPINSEERTFTLEKGNAPA